MTAINWRERFVAAGIHFLITLITTGAAALLIFLLWFPHGLADVVGGAKLFLIVVGSDLALGPAISLIIYNSRKSRRELVIDYSVVGAVQLVALAYGVSIVAIARPAIIAFDIDRVEIVTAVELDAAQPADAQTAFHPSWFGPRLVNIERPMNRSERNDLLFKEVTQGQGAYLFSKYYGSYDKARDAIRAKCKPIDTLLTNSGSAESDIRGALAKTHKPYNELCWLLVHHRFGFGSVVIDKKSAEPIEFMPINPSWAQ